MGLRCPEAFSEPYVESLCESAILVRLAETTCVASRLVEHGVEGAGVRHVERREHSADGVLPRVRLAQSALDDECTPKVLVDGFDQELHEARLAEATGVTIHARAERPQVSELE